MKKEFSRFFEDFSLLYYLIGAVIILLAVTRIGEFLPDNIVSPLVIIYFLTFTQVMSILYLFISCIMYKHKSVLMNIIESVLCFITIFIYPFAINLTIYQYNKYLYYFLVGCFVSLPIIYAFIDSEKVTSYHVVKTITRIFMVVFVIYVVLWLNSCST